MNNQDQKKILVVAESIDVDDSSGTKGRVALIKNLAKAGYEIRVFHYTRREIQLEEIPCFSIEENRSSLLFLLSRLERQLRHKLNLDIHKPLENIFGFSFTLINDRNSIVKALRDIKNFEPHLVLTLSKGGSFRPHHALLKMPEWHHKWMAYMHDPYPMHQYPRPFTWVEPGHKKKESFIRDISHKAKISAFPSLLLKDWMGKFHPQFLKTGIVIPHQFIDLDASTVGLIEDFSPNSFNLLHAGNLLGARNPKVLIEAFQKFIKIRRDAKNHSKLYFIGGNNKRVSAIAERDENIFISKSYIDFDKVFKMQQHTSVNIILEGKSDISPFLPGKFPHCVQADKPILLLGPNKSEARRLLGDNYPYWAEIDDLDRITVLIEKLYLEWKDQKKSPKLNRPDLVRYLSASHLKEIMEGLI